MVSRETQPEPDAVAEILDVLERIRAGWEHMDGEAVLACFEESARTVVIGTDASEYWVGYEALVEPFRAMAGTFSDAAYRWTDGPTVDVQDGVAWSTGKLLGAFNSGDDRIELDMRTTHVLRLSASGATAGTSCRAGTDRRG